MRTTKMKILHEDIKNTEKKIKTNKTIAAKFILGDKFIYSVYLKN